MAVNMLSGSLYNVGRTSSVNMMQSLIQQSTSMYAQVFAAVQSLGYGNSSTGSASAAYTDIDKFLKNYQSDLNALDASSAKLMQSNKKGVFAEYEAGKATTDDIVASMEQFVKDYNSVTSLLEQNADRGTGVTSHLNAFNRGAASDQALETLGITYDKDGDMQLDSEALKKALETDYDTTKKLIGGQYGLADRTAMKTENALSDSVQRIVNNDLNSLVSSTQNYSSIQYTYSFSRAGAYNLSNMYAIGLFVNTTA